MAKIVNGSLILDEADVIDFVDDVGVSHTIQWDDVLGRFVFGGEVEADQFIDVVNSINETRNPQPNDDTYEVPTIWINTLTDVAWVLVSGVAGNAVWKSFGTGAGDVDHRITINNGVEPSEREPYDMWVTLDE